MNKTVTIKLTTIKDVNDFVHTMTFDPNSKFDADIKTDRHSVDAKSIMGLFSLDLSKPVSLVICNVDTDEAALTGLLKSIDKFIVK